MESKQLKSKLRRILKYARNSLIFDKATKDLVINNKLISWVKQQNFKNLLIASYYAQDLEVNTKPFLTWCHQNNINCCLPVIDNKKMHFAWFTTDSILNKNKFKILEPDYQPQDLIAIDKISLFIIPLVAFDKKLFRLGQGGGYYDKLIEHLKTTNQQAKLVGLAYSIQKIPHIPVEPWDRALDVIFTDTNYYSASK